MILLNKCNSFTSTFGIDLVPCHTMVLFFPSNARENKQVFFLKFTSKYF